MPVAVILLWLWKEAVIFAEFSWFKEIMMEKDARILGFVHVLLLLNFFIDSLHQLLFKVILVYEWRKSRVLRREAVRERATGRKGYLHFFCVIYIFYCIYFCSSFSFSIFILNCNNLCFFFFLIFYFSLFPPSWTKRKRNNESPVLIMMHLSSVNSPAIRFISFPFPLSIQRGERDAEMKKVLTHGSSLRFNSFHILLLYTFHFSLSLAFNFSLPSPFASSSFFYLPSF